MPIPAHWWRFEETTGNTSADAAGGVTATLVNATHVTPGHASGHAVHINGNNNSYISFGNSLGQFGTSDFTVAFWVNTSENSIPLFDLFGTRTAPSHGNFLSIRMTGDHFGSLLPGAVVADVDEDVNGKNWVEVKSTISGLNDGKWHNIAVVRRGATLTLYVDGSLAGAAMGAGVANVNNGNDLRIGRSLVMNVPRFAPDALFDDVRIWNSAAEADVVHVSKHGVIDYPLYQGQQLTSAWWVVDNPLGPKVTAADGYLHYEVTGQQAAGQSRWVWITTPLPTQNGLTLTFRVRANTIQGQEARFTFAGGVALRFTADQEPAWGWMDGSTFRLLALSGVHADGAWHQITLSLASDQVSLFQDGRYCFTKQAVIGPVVTPAFAAYIQGASTNLSFDVGDIYASPATFAPGVDTPWDYAFRAGLTPLSEAVGVRVPQTGIRPSFHDGFVRFATRVAWLNGLSFIDVRQSTPPMSILTYQVRINTSAGSETKITLPGSNILRVTDNGRSAAWMPSDSGGQQLAPSGIVAGQRGFTVVTLITSAASVTLFENGAFKYQRDYPSPVTMWQPGLAVQHHDQGTSVSVDIGGIRVLPSVKPPTLLARDLQPHLLAYFPLKGDLHDAAGAASDLTAVGGNASFGPGRLGNAATFTPGGAVLAIPSLSLAASPSYTLSVWVKVNAYPPAGQLAGIAGFMLLSADGRVNYQFVYNSDRLFLSTVLLSRQPLSLGTWHNVVVAYTYEAGRLAFFIDGKLDNLYYLGPQVATRSGMIPAAGYVGGYQESFNGPMRTLNGAVGDVILLSQHVYPATAAMLANLGNRTADTVLVPVFLAVLGALKFAVEDSIVEQTEPNTPSLEQIVQRIHDRVYRPPGPSGEPGPAYRDRRVSRADLGIPDGYPITLDIGGEGPLKEGIVTGFPGVININAEKETNVKKPTVTVAWGPMMGAPIPLLVWLEAWDTNPPYPFADGFADEIVMIGAKLTDMNVSEMARVIKPGGEINLWVDDKEWGSNAEKLAGLLQSKVEYPGELPRLAVNGPPEAHGGTWFLRRRIVAFPSRRSP